MDYKKVEFGDLRSRLIRVRVELSGRATWRSGDCSEIEVELEHRGPPIMVPAPVRGFGKEATIAYILAVVPRDADAYDASGFLEHNDDFAVQYYKVLRHIPKK